MLKDKYQNSDQAFIDHKNDLSIHPRWGAINNAISSDAVRKIDTDSYSIGTNAGKAWVAESIIDSLAIGTDSQKTNESGTGIITIGNRSFDSITHDYNPYYLIAIGLEAGHGVIDADDEIYIGNKILSAAGSFTGLSQNIIIGHNALDTTTTFDGYDNFIAGDAVMQSAPCSGGPSENVIIGFAGTCGSLVGASFGIILGNGTAVSLTNGYSNVVIGDSAGYGLTTGSGNTFVGENAGGWTSGADAGPSTGDYNTAVGDSAGTETTGASQYCLSLGANAGPGTDGVYDSKGWIDYISTDTPCLGFDFIESRVGFSANVSSLTNIIHVVASSATDPIADSWTTHPCTRAEKDITGDVDAKKVLDSIKDVQLYRYKRKANLIQREKDGIRTKHVRERPNAEIEVVLDKNDNEIIASKVNSALNNKKLPQAHKDILESKIRKSYLKSKKARLEKEQRDIITEDDQKEIDKRSEKALKDKEKMPKFATERIGMMIDDPNIPNEILTFDEAGNKNGIDLLAYIGYLHSAIKALTAEVDALKA